MNKPKLIKHPNGIKEYRLNNGKFHRENGPAVEHPDGLKMWYFDGKPHREDGPAIYRENETINKIHWAFWHFHGKLHREDGPAVEISNSKEYWINGKEITKQEFNLYLKLKKDFHIKPNNFLKVLKVMKNENEMKPRYSYAG